LTQALAPRWRRAGQAEQAQVLVYREDEVERAPTPDNRQLIVRGRCVAKGFEPVRFRERRQDTLVATQL